MIVITIAVALAGLFFGYAVRQRIDLREARYDISAYQADEVKSAETIGNLRAQIRAHETSLVMLMKEIGK